MKKEIIKSYKELRVGEYPSPEEQLDYIYHHGLDAWRVMIKEIKDKYPRNLGGQDAG